MLAQDLYPSTALIRTDRNTTNPQPALLVQTTQLDQVPTASILPGANLFREKQTVHLRLGKEDIKVYLTKAQLVTQSFIRFEYELLNEEQENVVKDYIAKQSNEIKNNDLWEALKWEIHYYPKN